MNRRRALTHAIAMRFAMRFEGVLSKFRTETDELGGYVPSYNQIRRCGDSCNFDRFRFRSGVASGGALGLRST
jgi:hypothetical protein